MSDKLKEARDFLNRSISGPYLQHTSPKDKDNLSFYLLWNTVEKILEHLEEALG